MGYLATTKMEDFKEALQNVVSGNCPIEKRSLVSLTTERKDLFQNINFALNEVAILKRDTSSMIVAHTHVNGEFLTSYWGDGVLVSTPTGSTAYSLSANGPIVDPGVDALLINPICPHTLSHRPFLAPNTVSISIKLTSQERAMATVDGQEGEEILTGDIVEIRASEHRTQLIRFPGRSYFEVLRTKLRWGDGLV